MAKRGEPVDRVKAMILLTPDKSAQMRRVTSAKAELARKAGLPIPTEQDLIRAWVEAALAREAEKL